MKTLLTTLLSLTSLAIWAQTVQSPFSVARATTTTNSITNSMLVSSNLNLFATNGIFAGTNGIVLQDLQNDADELRALLAQLQGSTATGMISTATGGVITPGTFVSGNGQTLSQLALNLSNSAVAFSPTGQVSPVLTAPPGRLTGPNGPLTAAATPNPTLGQVGVQLRPSVFGTTVTSGTTQITQDQLALLASLQTLLLDIQADSQAVLPVINTAIVSAGGTGSQFGTNAGFGNLTNTFGAPLTNAFGTPLTNGFGAPLTNSFGTPLTNGFGAPLTNTIPLTNTFGVANPALRTPTATAPGGAFGPNVGGVSRSVSSAPGAAFGTTPQTPAGGGATTPQSPAGGGVATPQSPNMGTGTRSGMTPFAPAAGGGRSVSSGHSSAGGTSK
ncbi:hypothetical protein [Pedosphaera parvula]|nr:hypothetical protein [Pedosphaera parvula]